MQDDDEGRKRGVKARMCRRRATHQVLLPHCSQKYSSKSSLPVNYEPV